MPSPPRSRCASHTPNRCLWATLAHRRLPRTCMKPWVPPFTSDGSGCLCVRFSLVAQGPALDPTLRRLLAGHRPVGVVAVTLVQGFQFGDLAVVAHVALGD